MPTGARELIELAIDSWFTHDAQGRIGYDNEPGGLRAPRFVFARTAAGNLWRVRDDLSPATAHGLAELAAAELVVPDVRVAPAHQAQLRALLAVDSTGPEIDCGPAYCFPERLEPAHATTPITYANRSLMRQLVSDFDAFSREFAARLPRRAVVVGDHAVAVCFSARLSERVAEAGVETIAAFRGRGYAPAVVAAWALDVRAGGRIPLYSTSWDNTASRAVARKLGLTMYGSTWSLV